MIADWTRAGLPKPSLVKPVLTTLEPSLVIRALGSLGDADLASLRQLFSRSLASSPWRKSRGIRRARHPGGLCCASFKYRRYSRSVRLGRRAP
ncbi:MAG: hypothetical protein ABIX28_24230, partial [Vicinamibacterales bacterium]